jgi:hypothetical protein
MKAKALVLIASALCFIALADGLPYGYFTLLRFVVCAVSLYVAYKLNDVKEGSWWVWGFGLLAVLFNPIIPIYLTREQWQPIDLVIGIFLLTSVFWLPQMQKS